MESPEVRIRKQHGCIIVLGWAFALSRSAGPAGIRVLLDAEAAQQIIRSTPGWGAWASAPSPRPD